jgi:hypothetical protein
MCRPALEKTKKPWSTIQNAIIKERQNKQKLNNKSTAMKMETDFNIF